MVGQRNLGSGKKKGRSVRGKRETGAVDGLNLEKKRQKCVIHWPLGTCQQGMKIHFTDDFREGFQNLSPPPCLNFFVLY